MELIPKSNREGEHSADIKIGRLLWEMKAPKGEGSSLMKNTIQKAVKQSENVVLDLRRTKRHQTKCLSEIKREFVNSKSIRRIMIITKERKVIEMVK